MCIRHISIGCVHKCITIIYLAIKTMNITYLLFNPLALAVTYICYIHNTASQTLLRSNRNVYNVMIY